MAEKFDQPTAIQFKFRIMANVLLWLYPLADKSCSRRPIFPATFPHPGT